MPISPIGNVIYANQQAPMVSLVHQNAQMQTQLQSFFAQELFKEREDQVQAVAEAKDSDAVDPDRHFEGQEFAHEERKEKKEKPHEEPIKEHHSSLYLLDVKV